MAATMRIRIADIFAVLLWLTAIGLMALDTIQRDSEHNTARWGLLVGMMALTATLWSIATWMLEVIRLEYEITTLRRLSQTESRNRRGNG